MRTTDFAILYLRITVGALLILHNIGKFQNFNEISSNYHSAAGIPATLYFMIFALVESATAIMLIIGWHIRLAASILIVGTILALLIYYPLPSTLYLELQALYTFIYLYILIAGGGLYSIDGVRGEKN